MPKTAMHKQGDSKLGENDVGLSRQIGAVKSESQPQRMGDLADAKLRPGVLSPLFVPSSSSGARLIFDRPRESTPAILLSGEATPPQQDSTATSLIFGLYDRHQTASHPFSNRWRHGIANCMVAQTINPIRLTFIKVARSRPIVGESLHSLNFIGGKPPYPTIWKPNIITGPVCPGMSGRFRINTMGDALY